MQLKGNDPTVFGGAVPGGSVSLVISSMAPAVDSAKHANHGQVAQVAAQLEPDGLGGKNYESRPQWTKSQSHTAAGFERLKLPFSCAVS